MTKTTELGKCVGLNIGFITYDEVTPVSIQLDSLGNRTKKITYTSSGSVVRRVKKLRNAVMSFSYYLNDFSSDFMNSINTVNKNTLTVGGVTIPKTKGLLLKYLPTPIYMTRKSRSEQASSVRRYFKIDVEIEIEMQKSLLYTEYLDEDVYVNNPITGKKSRLQFCSDYEEFISNKEAYPNAVHIRDGFGFYSEDRPDLNVTENVPLDGMGNLLAKDAEPVFHLAYDSVIEDWGYLQLPRVCNTVNNINFSGFSV